MVKWNWTLSNGLKDTLQNPLFTLAAAGTFSAKLVGFTADGCISDTATKSFVVHPLPIADFKVVAPACETETVIFEQLSTANVGTLTRWNWRLGNATTPQDLTSPVTKTFASWGDQVIRLMVENSKGCKSDTTTKTIRIHPKPFVNNSIPEVCLNDAFAEFFDSTKIADNSTGFAHLWRFGDANAIPSYPDSSLLKDPRHKYTAAGTYTMSHRVTSLAGCVSTKTTSFIVSGAVPKSNFVVLLPDSLCSNDTVRIKNLSTVDFGFIGKLEIYWDYDNNPTIKDVDQLPDSGKIYKHVYPKFSNQALKPVRIVVRAFSGGSCSDEGPGT
jgi:PKD repeat protein